MMLHDTIKKELPEAMKARETERLRAVRNLLAALTNEVVAKGKKPQEMLTDEEVVTVVKRLSKQRKDSIAQFQEAGRTDLVVGEETELSYLKKYLPEEMNEEDVRVIIQAKKTELGISDKSGTGALMAGVMKELKGKAGGGMIKKIVDEILE